MMQKTYKETVFTEEMRPKITIQMDGSIQQLPGLVLGAPGLTATVGWEGRAIVCRFAVGPHQKPAILKRLLVEASATSMAATHSISSVQMVTRIVCGSWYGSRTYVMVDDEGDPV
mmetsp:Transcript_66637/g.132038  ORF Transcript_66637/g.132038 Transcript_66637/m.132038 type:complete len:115 (-) Transcript_66637:56-400(-)